MIDSFLIQLLSVISLWALIVWLILKHQRKNMTKRENLYFERLEEVLTRVKEK